jgi:EAL and modified HD-GYP domain-containing signal transduction protein
VELRPIARPDQAWVALWARVGHVGAAALEAVFGYPDVFAALAPMDVVLRVPHLVELTPAVFACLPPTRVVLAISAVELDGGDGEARLAGLQARGWRVLVDVTQGAGTRTPRAQACNWRARGAAGSAMRAAPGQGGPHLAYQVTDRAGAAQCAALGYGWLSGAYALQPEDAPPADGGVRRRRLRALGDLFVTDAPERAIDAQLRQDPALAYQLLKLVNSAALAPGVVVTGFQHALRLIGRVQLQRWLQLLLYARGAGEQRPSLLLPQAAQRAAQMEALGKLQRRPDALREQAFMVGMFSLLDVLLGQPMDELVGALGLPAAVRQALLGQGGELGAWLELVSAPAPARARLAAAGIDARMWWESQLHAYHWAIQVAGAL